MTSMHCKLDYGTEVIYFYMSCLARLLSSNTRLASQDMTNGIDIGIALLDLIKGLVSARLSIFLRTARQMFLEPCKQSIKISLHVSFLQYLVIKHTSSEHKGWQVCQYS